MSFITFKILREHPAETDAYHARVRVGVYRFDVVADDESLMRDKLNQLLDAEDLCLPAHIVPVWQMDGGDAHTFGFALGFIMKLKMVRVEDLSTATEIAVYDIEDMLDGFIPCLQDQDRVSVDIDAWSGHPIERLIGYMEIPMHQFLGVAMTLRSLCGSMLIGQDILAQLLYKKKIG